MYIGVHKTAYVFIPREYRKVYWKPLRYLIWRIEFLQDTWHVHMSSVGLMWNLLVVFFCVPGMLIQSQQEHFQVFFKDIKDILSVGSFPPKFYVTCLHIHFTCPFVNNYKIQVSTYISSNVEFMTSCGL